MNDELSTWTQEHLKGTARMVLEDEARSALLTAQLKRAGFHHGCDLTATRCGCCHQLLKFGSTAELCKRCHNARYMQQNRKPMTEEQRIAKNAKLRAKRFSAAVASGDEHRIRTIEGMRKKASMAVNQ